LREVIREFIRDRKRIIENLFSIVSKEGQILPFKMNPLQTHYWENRTQWDIILKARQMGFTSLILAEFLADALFTPNLKVVLIGQDDEFAKGMIRKVKFYWESLPELVRIDGMKVATPKREFEVGSYSDHLITWPSLGSSIQAGTSGSTKFGRGETVHRVLASEVAFWDETTASGILIAVESAMPPSGRFVQECTANGASGTFFEGYMAAKSRKSTYTPHFYVWPWDNEYRFPEGSPQVLAEDRGKLEYTPEEELIAQKLGLDEEQVRWRRHRQRNLGEKFPQEFPEDDMTCFLLSGSTIFDQDTIENLIGRCREPLLTRESGNVRIWQTRLPASRYIIGVDVATGYGLDPAISAEKRKKLRLDYSAAIVMNAKTLEHVATLHGNWDIDTCAELVVELAKEYNNALIAVEANGPGDSVLNSIVNKLNYHNIYWQESPQDKSIKRWGWWSDQASKPRMISEMKVAINSGAFVTWDEKLLGECRIFSKLTPTKVGALPGGHDDLVMAAGVAIAVRNEAPVLDGGLLITRR